MYFLTLWRKVAVSCFYGLETPCLPPSPPPLSAAWWKWTLIPDNQPLLVIRVFTHWWRPNCRVICHYIVMESPNQKSLERAASLRGLMHPGCWEPLETPAALIFWRTHNTICCLFSLLSFLFFSFCFETATLLHQHLLILSVKSERLRTWSTAWFSPFAGRLWSNRQTQQEEALRCWR